MPIIYHATYNITLGTFGIEEDIASATALGISFSDNEIKLLNWLKKYKGTPSEKTKESKKDKISLYVVYHPDADFWAEEKIEAEEKHHLFSQYLFLYDDERKANLLREMKSEEKIIYKDYKNEGKLASVEVTEHSIHQIFTKSVNRYNWPRVVKHSSLPMLPMIHITDEDFLNDEIVKKKRENNIFVPRYIRILDSSIWNHYVPHEIETGEKFEKRFGDALMSITTSAEQKLYNLTTAKEEADFKARLLFESYVEGDHHGDHISPFLFHSQRKMKEEKEKAVNYIAEFSRGKSLTWRFLFVDDYAHKPLKGHPDLSGPPEDAQSRYPTRLKILGQVLSEYADLEFKQKSDGATTSKTPCRNKAKSIGTIEIYSVPTLTEAKEMVFERRFDMILLDYLIVENEQPKFSHELLREVNMFLDETKTTAEREAYFADPCIEKNEILGNTVPEREERWKKARGIFKRFWFFNVSTFYTAVSQSLYARGFMTETRYWRIHRGACPTNTPELFSYFLFTFMGAQLRTLTELPGNFRAFSPKNGVTENRIITLLDLLRLIYTPKKNENNEGNSMVRFQAIKFFPALLQLREYYRRLLRDVEYLGASEKGITENDKKEYNKLNRAERAKMLKDNCNEQGSPLILSLFPDIVYYGEAFWEHVMHLVYLTAYGLLRQWEELRDEFFFVKGNLEEAEKEMKEIEKLAAERKKKIVHELTIEMEGLKGKNKKLNNENERLRKNGKKLATDIAKQSGREELEKLQETKDRTNEAIEEQTKEMEELNAKMDKLKEDINELEKTQKEHLPVTTLILNYIASLRHLGTN